MNQQTDLSATDTNAFLDDIFAGDEVLTEMFGLDELTDIERSELLSGLGYTVLQEACMEFLDTASDDEVKRINEMLSNDPEEEVLLAELMKCDAFPDIYQETVTRIIAETLAMMPEQAPANSG